MPSVSVVVSQLVEHRNSVPGSADFSAPSRAVCEMNPSGARCKPRYNLVQLAATVLLATLSFSSATTTTAAPSAKPKSLRIYFVDVEGGQATLFVTPEGQSLLIDTGWPGNQGANPNSTAPSATLSAARDADRIVAAAKDAGLKKIDFVLITHYHEDHVGGVPELAERIPIGTFIDHGENHEPYGQFSKEFFEAYQRVLATGKYQHVVAKPGDILPIKGMQAQIVTSDGEVVQKPLPGAGQPNSACNNFNPPADNSENRYSAGMIIAFGKLKILDLGDLTADKEKELICPKNRLGHVDIYIASHHGLFQSGSLPLVHAIAPRVAIVDNGERKGGSRLALDIIKSSPTIAGIWQLHFSEEAAEHNAPPEYVANRPGPDAGNYLKMTARQDGSFEVFNSRTKKAQRYAGGDSDKVKSLRPHRAAPE